MKLRYVKKGEYQGPNMEIDKVYEVIGIEADDYRIIDDSNMPFLYNSNQFEIVSSDEPNFWVTEYGGNGERYSYPATWTRAGFFEDFHGNVSAVVSKFWSKYWSLYSASTSV